MNSPQEIKQAILQLAAIDREDLARWLDDINDRSQRIAEPALAYGAKPGSPLLTADEYFEFEQNAAIRHEFVGGMLYAMSGCSEPHHRIALNLVAAIHTHLRGGPCKAYMSDFKLRLKAGQDTIFYYPDVMVACGEKSVSDYYLEQPKLVIEVLSASTERIDRYEKALNYRHIATLEEFVLIAQNRPHMEIQRRAEGWQSTVVTSLDATAEFRSIALSLPLQQIYEDVPNTGTEPLT